MHRYFVHSMSHRCTVAVKCSTCYQIVRSELRMLCTSHQSTVRDRNSYNLRADWIFVLCVLRVRKFTRLFIRRKSSNRYFCPMKTAQDCCLMFCLEPNTYMNHTDRLTGSTGTQKLQRVTHTHRHWTFRRGLHLVLVQ